jgi:hypothetical protein
MPHDTGEPSLPQEGSQRIAAPASSTRNREILQQLPAPPSSRQEEDDRTVTVPKLRRNRQIHIKSLQKNTEDRQTPAETAQNAAPTATNDAPDTLEGVMTPSLTPEENL